MQTKREAGGIISAFLEQLSDIILRRGSCGACTKRQQKSRNVYCNSSRRMRACKNYQTGKEGTRSSFSPRLADEVAGAGGGNVECWNVLFDFCHFTLFPFHLADSLAGLCWLEKSLTRVVLQFGGRKC